MPKDIGKDKLTALQAEVKELRDRLNVRDAEIKELKKKRRKPDKRDIVAILRCLGVDLPPGQHCQWREFWSEVIYPHRFSKRGLARKEMLRECKEIGHPWGTEPIRRAIVVLREAGLLKKKGTRYPVDLARLHELAH